MNYATWSPCAAAKSKAWQKQTIRKTNPKIPVRAGLPTVPMAAGPGKTALRGTRAARPVPRQKLQPALPPGRMKAPGGPCRPRPDAPPEMRPVLAVLKKNRPVRAAKAPVSGIPVVPEAPRAAARTAARPARLAKRLPANRLAAPKTAHPANPGANPSPRRPAAVKTRTAPAAG